MTEQQTNPELGPKLAELDEEFQKLRDQKNEILEAEGIPTTTAGSIKFSVGEKKLGMHLQPGDKISAEFGGSDGKVTRGIGKVLGEIRHMLVQAPDGRCVITPVDPRALLIRDADDVHHVAYDISSEVLRDALRAKKEDIEKDKALVEEIKENIPPEVKEVIQNEVSV